LFPLNVLASLQVQSKGVHSLPWVHAAPGGLGPVGPASGGLVAVPVHPPWLVQRAGHWPLAGPQTPPVHAAPAAGFAPSLHAQTRGAQSAGDVQPAHPPSLAHAAGQTSCGAGEQ
jgi:hypothetical protein